MIRYEETPEHVFKLFKEIQTTYFPELRNAKISILYDLKKSSKGGKVQLGCIKRPNDLIRHFSKDEAIAIEGYDYIIILDKVCFENVSERDRERILRHELRHTYFDIDTEDNPYRLVDHDITDFYAEIELNKDDPRWGQRCAALTADIYEQMKEAAKDNRKRKKKAARQYDIHPRQMTIPEDSGITSITISHIDGNGNKEEVVTLTKETHDRLEEAIEKMNTTQGLPPEPQAAPDVHLTMGHINVDMEAEALTFDEAALIHTDADEIAEEEASIEAKNAQPEEDILWNRNVDVKVISALVKPPVPNEQICVTCLKKADDTECWIEIPGVGTCERCQKENERLYIVAKQQPTSASVNEINEKRPTCEKYDEEFGCSYLNSLLCTKGECCEICEKRDCRDRCQTAMKLDEVAA